MPKHGSVQTCESSTLNNVLHKNLGLFTGGHLKSEKLVLYFNKSVPVN